MGNAVSGLVSEHCRCLEFTGFTSVASDEENLLKGKLDSLKLGARFMKKAMLGLSCTEIEVKLSDDATLLKWSAVQANSSLFGGGKEKAFVDLTTVADVRAEGPQSLLLLDKAKAELACWTAETPKIRDHWVSVLRELLESWTASPMERPKQATLSSDATSDKAAYFARRAEEVQLRTRERDEKKAKYVGGGMKYTALALAKRSEA